MGITNSNKTISVDRIECDGTLRVTLALTAAPDIVTNPTDIALVLDRSGSMTGTPLTNMKAGADTFIDIIAEATGGTADGQIGSGSHIGIVSFADTAVQDTGLITSVAALKAATAALTADGLTNHGAAFTQATALLSTSTNNRVMVMFTDGETTTGPDPSPIAAAARAMGITIYCIGLIGNTGIDVDALNDWATDPDASHVAVTPDAAELEELFAELAANISKTGATDIVINEVLNPDFTITSLDDPTRGSASTLDSHTIRWTIPALGVTGSESAVLEFFVRHTSEEPGEKLVNESIEYTDAEGNLVVFPKPKVTVDCSVVVQPDPCPVPVDLVAEGCKDTVLVDMGDVFLESQGRILQLDVTVKNVCPGKRVALATILTEVDENGTEYQRGMKVMTLPAHSGPACRDVRVKCIKFVVPEDLDVSGGSPVSLCNPRNFKARFLANVIDTDYRCCESLETE